MSLSSVAHFAVMGSLAVILTGCAYRFTNAHVSRPKGVQTIAVEAIYDTSREVLPHELLWESLQNAIAADGHLRLAPQSSADALLRAHIKQASVDATGVDTPYPNSQNYMLGDPNPFNRQTPPTYDQFRRLTQAGRFRSTAAVTAVVDVEVVDLNTHAVLLRKTYPLSQPFTAVHSDAVPSSSLANDHLRYDEAANYSFKTMSDNLANSVVSDLLVH